MVSDVGRMYEDYCAAWNSHDVEKIASFFTDDGIFDNVAAETVSRGKEEMKAAWNDTFAGIPDLKLEWPANFIASDWIATEWIMTGTHTGDLPMLPATGKSVSIRGASIMELQGGKIKRHVTYMDMASFMRQLGVMP